MVKIVIENWGQKELTSADTTKTALAHFQENHLDWMHACGGKGRCTTCRFIVLEGALHLASPTPAELKYRREGMLGANERLSCQAIVTGDVRVRIPDDCKWPHVSYDA